MKSILSFIALFLLSLGTASAQDDASEIVKFDAKSLHLGKIKKGDKINSEFIFTNTSDEEVTIDLVSTCECTEAKWPASPIPPGESATIRFVFDSSQKEVEETIQVDVYFLNINPTTDAPYSAYLEYTYEYQ